ncbi:hypothetical protein CL654_03165 [bacterium]|nr:hypothetical protein [bacterium]|tara:strand:+ start:20078 stop:22012 length:1935 start_codon:yes stop_codon:yes gene_type:complete
MANELPEDKNEESHLGDLEKKLYQKDSNLSYKRQRLDPRDVGRVAREWKQKIPNKQEVGKKVFQTSFLNKLLLFSIGFFILAVSVSFYFIWIKPRVTSPQNIDILVKAPASVQGGEEVPFQIIITNENDVALETADLRIQFPEGVLVDGVRPVGDRYTDTLGVLQSGQSITKDLDLTFFGEENTERDLLISLEYRAQGSSATFSKEKDYTVVLATSPVSLSVDIPTEVNAGEDFAITIDTISNSNSVVNDFMIVAEYPFGFTFETSDPRPTFGDNIWFLGDLSPSARKNITVIGSIEGQPNEERTFKINAGIQDPNSTREIDVLYNSFVQTVPIEQPFVAVDFVVNGERGSEVAAQSGKTIAGEITWENNTDSRILNGELSVLIRGDVFDEGSVKPDKGFYDSSINTILWNQNTDRTLQVIESGESGTVRFNFDTVSLFGAGGSNFTNPNITLSLIFRGERISPGFPSETIRVTQEKDIKISSALQLNAFATHSVGPFGNTGPIPPKAEQRTTYTVTWALVNSSNRISNAQVKSSIPLYVTWKDLISPLSEDVRFNSTTGEITWNVSSLSPGARKEVSFQIELLPSLSQVGTIPVILFQSDLEGFDTFTGQTLRDQESSISTALDGNNDPLFIVGTGNNAQVTQ